jgi:alkylation response protein AidB-like acyl-CoA dehydrogenase
VTQFALSDEQLVVRDMAKAFADDRLAGGALEWDRKRIFPVEVMREAAALGMAAIYVREDVGGSGMTRLDAALIFEALATGCPTVSAYISIHNMVAWMIDRFGADEQRRRWVPGLCTMELLASGAGRRRLCGRRRQAVHLGRRRRGPLPDDGPHRRRRRRRHLRHRR